MYPKKREVVLSNDLQANQRVISNSRLVKRRLSKAFVLASLLLFTNTALATNGGHGPHHSNQGPFVGNVIYNGTTLDVRGGNLHSTKITACIGVPVDTGSNWFQLDIGSQSESQLTSTDARIANLPSGSYRLYILNKRNKSCTDSFENESNSNSTSDDVETLSGEIISSTEFFGKESVCRKTKHSECFEFTVGSGGGTEGPQGPVGPQGKAKQVHQV